MGRPKLFTDEEVRSRRIERQRLVREKNGAKTGKRPVIVYDDGIAIVELTKGYFAGIDAVDAEVIGQWNWHAQICNGEVYAARSTGSPKKIIYMHRFLCDSEDEVDHINTVKLDNRRLNLRPADRFQNTRNGNSKGGSSVFKGVYRNTNNSKWIAQITVNLKGIYLGSFDLETDAKNCYDKASVELHGVYGRTNEQISA